MPEIEQVLKTVEEAEAEACVLIREIVENSNLPEDAQAKALECFCK